jgi:hypoxanthine phosphoribosyltransferase
MSSYTVLTLPPEDFCAACHRLEQSVRADAYTPELIVGIRTGGSYVASEMFNEIPHLEITLQRPSTHQKQRLGGKLLRHLPYPVTDRLRVAEAWWLGRKHPIQSGTTQEAEHVTLPEYPALPLVRRILVVDDAVDSGRTLLAVVRALQKQCPQAEIRSAVLTVTTEQPQICPEYKLYEHKTLIRFPWSLDMKSKP